MAGKISEDTTNNTAADASLVPIVEGGVNKNITLGAVRGTGYATSSNASGNTTITVPAYVRDYLAVTAISGSGSTTRIFVLAVSAPPATGAILRHRVDIPATASITLEWRDATSGGTLLTSFVTDGSGDDVFAEFYFDSAAWKFLAFIAPANA